MSVGTVWRRSHSTDSSHHVVVEGGCVIVDGPEQFVDLMVEDGNQLPHLGVQVLPLALSVRHFPDHARQTSALLVTRCGNYWLAVEFCYPAARVATHAVDILFWTVDAAL